MQRQEYRIQIHKCQTQHRWVTEKSFQLGNQIFAMAPFDPTLDPTPSSWVVGPGWLLFTNVGYAGTVLFCRNT